MTILIFQRILHNVAHIKAALRPGLDQPLGLQQVVGGHHRVGAHALLARAFTHRGQARASRQQPRAYALGQTLGQLLGQGQGRLAGQGDGHGDGLRTVLKQIPIQKP
ncbi:hypothetical protein SDC9_207126 [bioreactor metagenome]|uniref:Uncharacterized protein n=1 Tax=bioreactor metagenome TaxID=1076179 RepID=A0A645J6R4_9ZZZZ